MNLSIVTLYRVLAALTKALDEIAADNRLIVRHKDGRCETIGRVELNPAGEIIIVLET